MKLLSNIAEITIHKIHTKMAANGNATLGWKFFLY